MLQKANVAYNVKNTRSWNRKFCVQRPSTIGTLPCIDHRPSELYCASTIDHPNSTVHRPSTIAFQKTCIGHRTSKFRTSLDFGGRSQNGTTFEKLDLCFLVQFWRSTGPFFIYDFLRIKASEMTCKCYIKIWSGSFRVISHSTLLPIVKIMKLLMKSFQKRKENRIFYVLKRGQLRGFGMGGVIQKYPLVEASNFL